jgi:anion-transporting  ArsA/GET3 family ATPase
VYKNVSAIIAGMQEYTAVEALHGFVTDGRYDLVVLDTPPSANALRFLDAPARVNAFLDRRVFGLFVPSERSAIHRAAAKVLAGILDRVLGEADRKELQQFMQLFEGILGHLNHNQAEMRAFFQGSEVSFLLVTSPAREAVEEAFHFESKIHELGVSSCGYILNRSLAGMGDLPFPSEACLPEAASAAARSAIHKLAALAVNEPLVAREHEALATELERRAGPEGFVCVLPRLSRDASELEALVGLAERFQEQDPGRASRASIRPLSAPPRGSLPPSVPWSPPVRR